MNPIEPSKQSDLDIRVKISEILVKWNMPTRQAAISEIMDLISKAQLAAELDLLRDLLTQTETYEHSYTVQPKGHVTTVAVPEERIIAALKAKETSK